MRFALLPLAVLLATAAGAQSSFSASPGVYLTLDALDPLRLGDGTVEAGGGVGWRFGNGLDVGFRVGAKHTAFDAPDRTVSEARQFALAVEAGYAAWFGERVGARLGVWGGLQQTVEVGAPTYTRDADGAVMVIDRGNRDVNSGGVRIEPAMFVRVPVGPIAFQPTVSAFVGGGVRTTAEAERPFTLRADAGHRIGTHSAAEATSGLALSVPVLFEVSGVALALDPRAAYDVSRNAPAVDLRLRANF